VKEREVRRQKAIKAIKHQDERNWTARQIEAIKWKEWVNPHQTFPSGFSVFTHRVESD